MPSRVEKSTVANIESAANFADLLAEYANECAILGLPHPSGRIELYKLLEKSGSVTMQPFAAYEDALLIGFAVLLTPTNFHYGACLAVTESIFVGKAYRKTGAGIKLIRMVERKAEEATSPGVFISAPAEGDLVEILPRMGYELTNFVFFKSFNKTSPECIPMMSDQAVSNVYKLEEFTKKLPQIAIKTDHVLHDGMYARTIKIPAGVTLTGALIKIATTLIVSGDAIVYMDGEAKRFTGYHVFAARAHRKQAFIAQADTYMTMFFPTDAKTVEAAEEQFTDEAHLLFSRHPDAQNQLITED